ncbi:hypothetical protein [Pseudodesulfovibrio tunisiensis]|uniref:hypothetical protein n=1 Tax=Pseudodesulfovibrio tunisiensis TaxID=463192 RepID=UPI001FB50026|nr:hypothetical protein [Pseudodesulfovibrio tunisiensis]
MNLSAPNLLTWVVGVLLGALGICIHLDVMSVPALEDLVTPFWLVSAGFVVLAVSSIFRRL